MTDSTNANPEASEPNAGQQRREEFDLHSFFPYRVRVFYKAVHQSVADVYRRRHGLSAQEWRIMAVLGFENVLSATEIVARSSMNKVAVSRGLVACENEVLCPRNQILAMGDERRCNSTRGGREVFSDLIPEVLAVEREDLGSVLG